GTSLHTRTVYDYAGRPQETIEGPAEDVRHQYVYDGFGRPSRIHRIHRSGGSVTATGATLKYVWGDPDPGVGERGIVQRIELREYPGTESEALLSREEFLHDQWGRIIKKIERPFTVGAFN